MNELMAPEAMAERRRIQDALRRMAKRYEQHPRDEPAELTIRRAIEELFEAPIHEKQRSAA